MSTATTSKKERQGGCNQEHHDMNLDQDHDPTTGEGPGPIKEEHRCEQSRAGVKTRHR